MASDEDVIAAVLSGETERYAELVTRYQRAARALAFSLVGNLEDAKDLSQHGFVQAYTHLARFRRQARFSTWLYRIVVNACMDFLRRRARRPRVVDWTGPASPGDEELFEVADPGRSPSEVAADRELGRQLHAAITALPERQRLAVVLHHVHGLPLEQAAAIMDCRVGTVKAHLFRACETLRERLRPMERMTEVPV